MRLPLADLEGMHNLNRRVKESLKGRYVIQPSQLNGFSITRSSPPEIFAYPLDPLQKFCIPSGSACGYSDCSYVLFWFRNMFVYINDLSSYFNSYN